MKEKLEPAALAAVRRYTPSSDCLSSLIVSDSLSDEKLNRGLLLGVISLSDPFTATCVHKMSSVATGGESIVIVKVRMTDVPSTAEITVSNAATTTGTAARRKERRM